MPRSPSSQTNPRVMSASRSEPLPKEQEDIRKRLKSGGANAALNALSILKEMVQDFREQDRFFKYKAFIVGGWLLLTVVTVGTTCGRGVKTMGDFGASLVVPKTSRSLTLINKSGNTWTDVIIVVKDELGQEWRATTEKVVAGESFTVSPKVLIGAGSKVAPSDIIIRGVELRTSDGRAKLLDNGVNLTHEPAQ